MTAVRSVLTQLVVEFIEPAYTVLVPTPTCVGAVAEPVPPVAAEYHRTVDPAGAVAAAVMVWLAVPSSQTMLLEAVGLTGAELMVKVALPFIMAAQAVVLL